MSKIRSIAPWLVLLCSLSTPAMATEVEVRVEGITGNQLENVLGALSIQRYRSLPELNETMVRRLHARAPGEIQDALAPFGFYEISVGATLEPRGTNWEARYSITLGEPVRIGAVDILVQGPGSEHAAFHTLSNLPQRGDRLRHQDYERIKQQIRDAASAMGYLDARFIVSELRVSVSQRTADIRLHMETGERYRFGEVTLEQDILDEAFLRRFIQFKQGDPFNLGRLLALQYSLSDSEYFSAVEIDASRSLAEGLDVPVTVRMKPGNRHRYSAGVGYATDTGPRGIVGWENRRVNDRGHRLGAELRLSSVFQSLATRYMIPLRNPVWERLTFAGSVTREELGDVDSERAELSLAWTTRMDRWQRTLTTTVLSERGNRTQLVPSGEWIYTGGETGARPRDASRFTIYIAASDPVLGAPIGFVQVRTRGRMIFPVGERDRLLLRMELGAISSRDASLLPASQRFFAGGDYSVRGYRYNSLGPTDVDGNVIGGQYLATVGVEWEHWLNDEWGIGVFADHGGAFNSTSDRLSTGAGAGVRWQLPFAVFAFDMAHPFDDPRGRKVRLHLTLGIDL